MELAREHVVIVQVQPSNRRVSRFQLLVRHGQPHPCRSSRLNICTEASAIGHRPAVSPGERRALVDRAGQHDHR